MDKGNSGMDSELWIDESVEFDEYGLDENLEAEWYWDDDTQTLYRLS